MLDQFAGVELGLEKATCERRWQSDFFRLSRDISENHFFASRIVDCSAGIPFRLRNQWGKREALVNQGKQLAKCPLLFVIN
jgi:hypothetical protein